MFVELAIGNVIARADLFESAPRSIQRLVAALPLERVALVPSCWSGSVLEVDLSGSSYEQDASATESLGCSLYPGMLSLRRDRKILEISYGTAESRSPAGVEYGVVIGRIGHNRREFLSTLATAHDVGDLRGSIRAVAP
jgi:hypothetical protein